MKTRIIIFLAVALIACSCTYTGRRPDGQSQDGRPTAAGPVNQEPPAETPEPEAVPLPFTLHVGDEMVGPDLRVSVPENQGTVIQYESQASVTCELWVQHADSENAIAVGSWNGEMAQYYQEFPYGENHLLLTYGDHVYDILVVAGAPAPETGDEQSDCGATLMDLNADSRWEFKATQNGNDVGTLVQYVTNMAPAEGGGVGLTLVAERRDAGNAGNNGTVQVQLVCQGEIILVKEAVEKTEMTTLSTVYNDGSVYLPSMLDTDIWWERQATSTAESGLETQTYQVNETYHCTGSERISIAAGEFDAYKVEYRIEQTGKNESVSFSGVSWYVPGLGRILNIADMTGSPRIELVSYENVSPRQ
jgi:hypothetical protein